MSERAVRLLVLAALVPLAIAGIAANIVLGHGSGTYYGFVIYLVIVGAFGGLAWREPRPRWLVVWSLVGWVATIAHQTFGDPYAYELADPAWPYVGIPLWIGIAVMVFAVPIAAVGGAARSPAEPTLLAMRIRRVARLAALCAFIGVLAFVMSLRGLLNPLALMIPFYAALALVPGIRAYRDPQRRRAWLWALWASLLAALGAAVTSDIDKHPPPMWQLAFVCLGTMLALLVVALPLVALLTRDQPGNLPAARVR